MITRVAAGLFCRRPRLPVEPPQPIDCTGSAQDSCQPSRFLHPHKMAAVAQAMLNDSCNDLYYNNNDKKVSRFTLDGSCQAASLSWWATDPGCSGRGAAHVCDGPLMHGGHLISSRSRRTRPADDGLHLLLHVVLSCQAAITQASPLSCMQNFIGAGL